MSVVFDVVSSMCTEVDAISRDKYVFCVCHFIVCTCNRPVQAERTLKWKILEANPAFLRNVSREDNVEY